MKNYFLENVITSKGVGYIKLAVGGALLWFCNWNKNEKFTDIFKKDIDKCLIEKFNVVVFDGYTSSKKDVTRKSRSGKMSQTVEIDDSNMSTTNRNDFLRNYNKKEKFVAILALKLKTISIRVVCCSSDTGPTIVK